MENISPFKIMTPLQQIIMSIININALQWKDVASKKLELIKCIFYRSIPALVQAWFTEKPVRKLKIPVNYTVITLHY